MVNNVTLVGYVGRDAEVKNFKDSNLMKFSLATQENKKAKTEWHKIVMWGDHVEKLAPHITKGKCICVEGSLTYNEWEDKKSGAKKIDAQIKANRVSFIGKKEKAEDEEITEDNTELF